MKIEFDIVRDFFFLSQSQFFFIVVPSELTHQSRVSQRRNSLRLFSSGFSLNALNAWKWITKYSQNDELHKCQIMIFYARYFIFFVNSNDFSFTSFRIFFLLKKNCAKYNVHTASSLVVFRTSMRKPRSVDELSHREFSIRNSFHHSKVSVLMIVDLELDDDDRSRSVKNADDR